MSALFCTPDQREKSPTAAFARMASQPVLKVVVAEDSELQKLVLCGLINGMGFEAIIPMDQRPIMH